MAWVYGLIIPPDFVMFLPCCISWFDTHTHIYIYIYILIFTLFSVFSFFYVGFTKHRIKTLKHCPQTAFILSFYLLKEIVFWLKSCLTLFICCLSLSIKSWHQAAEHKNLCYNTWTYFPLLRKECNFFKK